MEAQTKQRRSFGTARGLLALALAIGLFAPAGTSAADVDGERKLERYDARVEHWNPWGGKRLEHRAEKSDDRIARLNAWLARWLGGGSGTPRNVPPVNPADPGVQPSPRGPVAATPEPGSALVFSAGLIVAAAVRRHGRRSSA